MVQSDKIRADFVRRLKEALAQAGIAEWGAGARLAEIAGTTAKATSKWLNGEAMPGRKNMLAVAEALRVRVEWLQYGEGPMRTGEAPEPGSKESPTGDPAPLTIAGLLRQLEASPDSVEDEGLKRALIDLLSKYQENPQRGAEIAAAITLLIKKD